VRAAYTRGCRVPLPLFDCVLLAACAVATARVVVSGCHTPDLSCVGRASDSLESPCVPPCPTATVCPRLLAPPRVVALVRVPPLYLLAQPSPSLCPSSLPHCCRLLGVRLGPCLGVLRLCCSCVCLCFACACVCCPQSLSLSLSLSLALLLSCSLAVECLCLCACVRLRVCLRVAVTTTSL